MAQPLATTAIRTAKDTRPTVDVEASSRHCLDEAVHGCILRSSLLKVSTPPSRSPRTGGARVEGVEGGSASIHFGFRMRH